MKIKIISVLIMIMLLTPAVCLAGSKTETINVYATVEPAIEMSSQQLASGENLDIQVRTNQQTYYQVIKEQLPLNATNPTITYTISLI